MKLNRYYTERAELYYLIEYLDYSNKTFPYITIQLISKWMRLHE